MVVSPLIALMKEHVASFSSRGISAAYVSDKDDRDLTKEARRGIEKGQYQLVFFSPEALFVSLEWRRILSSDIYRANLVGFIIDEAHCVKKW